MRTFPTLSALFISAILLSNPTFAFSMPGHHLKSETKDATLITSAEQNQNAVSKNASALEVFVNTLLGKDIDRVAEKEDIAE